MTITVVGEIKLGSALPAVTGAYATALADIEAKIAALANFSVTPPSLELDIEVSAQTTLALGLNVELGVTPPSIQAQLDITLALLLKLRLELGVLLDLNDLLQAGAFVYSYAGPTASFGSELDAELSPGLPGGAPGDTAFGVVLVATAPGAILALQSLFKTTP